MKFILLKLLAMIFIISLVGCGPSESEKKSMIMESSETIKQEVIEPMGIVVEEKWDTSGENPPSLLLTAQISRSTIEIDYTANFKDALSGYVQANANISFLKKWQPADGRSQASIIIKQDENITLMVCDVPDSGLKLNCVLSYGVED